MGGGKKRAYVGTSGWIYKHWNGIFYPPHRCQGEQLVHYARHFDSVEINYSFYRLPSREVFARWRGLTPEGFVFAAKASRYLTHLKKLKEPREPIRRLIEAAGGLEEKLGPLLFQFPAQWDKNLPRLEGLLEVLPPKGLRFAFEFRHPSWLDEEVYAALERYGCALCIPDHPDMPKALRLTADFTYVRFHRGEHSDDYGTGELTAWAARLRGFLSGGADVYAYFNNDIQGFALRNAAGLKSLLDQGG